MALPHQRIRKVCNTAPIALVAALTLLPLSGMTALERLDDAAMSDVSGAGMAFVWEDFRWLTKPTSYFEQVGSAADPFSTFLRGDLRWYGLSVSATGAGTHWTETGGNMDACANMGFGGLGCPRGGTISDFAAHDNPYVLRVMDYSGEGSAASAIGNGVVTWTGDTSTSKTVLELLAPTEQDEYRFSFWGEIEAGKNPGAGTNQGLLKTQTLIQGNAADSIIRFFQFTEPGNENLAIMYHSQLRGDFRFSAGQMVGKSSDELGVPVAFDHQEGLHFRNVDAFIPLGQLFYQALTIDVPKDGAGNEIQDGNFVLQIDAIPDELAVYRRHYSLAVSDSLNAGYTTARAAILESTYGATPAVSVPANYYKTHGYSRWGDWFPCQGVGCPAVPSSGTITNAMGDIVAKRNSYNSTEDGIFFSKCSGCSDFNAMAFMLTSVDVRPGQSQYTCPGGSNCGAYTPRGGGGRYYRQQASCTPSSGSDYGCGYGGGYSINAGTDFTTANKVNPAYYFGVGSGSATAIPVINTSVANLGDSRAEGLMINEFRFTSLGAQY